MTTAEVSCLTAELEETRKPKARNQYRKRTLEVKYVEEINQQLLDNKENTIWKDETTVRLDTVTLGVPDKYPNKISSILCKHETMRDNELG